MQKHFEDEKLAKQVFNAAKRVTKKRTSADEATSPVSKRSRKSPEPSNPLDDARAFEESLKLPSCNVSEDELRSTVLQSNRAPLVLAFCVILLQYTMPEQPLSSRLSLGQAVVSLGAKSKAYAIGLEKNKPAEAEGWAQGQPKVRIMGRDIPIMRRSGYHIPPATEKEEAKDDSRDPPSKKVKTENDEGKGQGEVAQPHQTDQEDALWGLDLETLRTSNGPLIPQTSSRGPNNFNGLPIFSPVSARSYILKSFALLEKDLDPDLENTSATTTTPAKAPKKKTPAQLTAEKSQAVALLLQAIDLLFASWAGSLSKQELDRRAWSWYVSVRPDVKPGQSGWGQRGEVRLERILHLRKGS